MWTVEETRAGNVSAESPALLILTVPQAVAHRGFALHHKAVDSWRALNAVMAAGVTVHDASD
jgi:hypothetical protein